MSNHKRVVLMVFLLMFTMYAMSYQPVEALPFEYEVVDQKLEAGEWYYYYDTYAIDDILNAYLETDDTTMLVDFFICDAVNYATWVADGTGSGYGIESDVHTNFYSYDVESSGTWYAVVSNRYGSSTVYVDIAYDKNADNRPVFSGYDLSVNHQLMEVNNQLQYSYSLGEGSIISGDFATYFSSDGVDFFICDEYNFNQWDDGYTADVYRSIIDLSSSSISSFTIPYDGTWYIVFSTWSQVDAVTLSFGIDVLVVEPVIVMSSLLGILGTLAIVGIICFCCCRKKRQPSQRFEPARGFTPSSGFGDARSSDNVVLGALKSYPRIGMKELADILKIPVDQVRRTTLRLIGTGAVTGTFDRRSDEFTSIAATTTGRELREDYGDAFALPRCPNCSAPLSKPLLAGETMECPNCGTWVTG